MNKKVNSEPIDLDADEPIDSDEEETSEEAGSSKDAPRKGFHLNLHVILIAAICLIAVIAGYRLYRWNQGGISAEDEVADVDPSEFDIETLDMIIPMDASALEGHEDDGVTTILCLGNNPFSDDRDSTGLAAQLASKTGATVYDCAFPDSSAACKYATYDPTYTKDHFNLYYVVECFRNNEFTAISSIAGDEPDPRFMDSVNVMKTVDMDKVDIIVIMYDSTDYNMGTPSDNPDNPYDVTAFTGGLRVSIDNIKKTWPYIRVIVMSPTYAQAIDEDGNLYNGTTKDWGNGTLNHYLVKEADAVMDCGVSFIDNYYGTINEDNYQEYMIDYMRYNDAGREKLADRLADVINNKLSTVSSTAG